MKKSIMLTFLLLIILSCKEEKSNIEIMESLMTEYNEINNDKEVDASFEIKLLDFRDMAIESNDDKIIQSIDSILLDGLSAPIYKEESLAVDSTKIIGRRCKTIDDAANDVSRIRKNNLRLPNTPIEVEIVVHVIQTIDNSGFISESVLQRQLLVLNNNFSNTLFTFRHTSTDYTKNNDWYFNVDIGNTQEIEMHKALSVNPQKVLNVYFVGNSEYLGYAQFPWENKSEFDGVVIYNESVPGGSATDYNEGKTLTHEIGHYLGLWHTFHKGCDVGDNVDDTPQQATSTAGCPSNRDTCPSDGLDPINNYLDYSYDTCMTEFTVGQNERMNWAVRKYRKDLIQPSI